MTLKLKLLAAGLWTVAATGAALAGDWNNGAGGLKGRHGAAVPVPAPIGIHEGPAEWYLRADVGVGFGKTGGISTGGLPLGLFGGFEDQASNGFVKLGFGRYVTPTLRAELSIDLRPQQKITRDRRNFYSQDTTGQGIIVTDSAGIDQTGQLVETFDFARDQGVTTANQTLMVNLYKDFGSMHGLTPYISGGIGLVVRTTKYSHQEAGACRTGTVTYSDSIAGTQTFSDPGLCFNTNVIASESRGHDVGYGVALSVGTGFGYRFAENLTWDFGYRYLWQNQQMSLKTSAGLTGTEIQFDWRGEHEVSTGLRVDLN
jgi:opacity protein-like surface antigen